ncbi:MAG: putative peptidoglycan glycosyltransferase FtsW [Pseudomonadota bacterium]
MTDMVFGTVAAKPAEPLISRWWRTVDHVTIGAVLLLCLIGLLLGFAASAPLASRNGLGSFYYVQKQIFFGSLALITMVIVSMMSPNAIRRWGVFGFIGAMIAVALLPWLGTDFGKGAVRWYSLDIISIQPSEFLKPVFVILTAWMMAASLSVGGPPGRLLSFMVLVGVIASLVIQPDFGQSMVVFLAWLVMFFVSGAAMTLMVVLAALAVAVGVYFYSVSEHFANRINGFLNPDIDPRTQLGYAANAIQEGGFFGVGVGQGTVKWSLPDAHTDFIIAVAAEEYGLILVFVIIGLFATIVLRGLFRLTQERNPFIRLAGTGLLTLFGMQALINMAVAVRLVPAKGMTLPFVSYGGSSMLAMGLLMGCVLAFTRARPQGALQEALGDATARADG